MIPRGLALLTGGTDTGRLPWRGALLEWASVVKEAMDSTWGMLNLRFLGGPHLSENSLRVGSKGEVCPAHLSPQHRPCHVVNTQIQETNREVWAGWRHTGG